MRIGNYNCFSYKQREYLFKNGLKEIHEMVHSETGRTFWVYLRNEQLDELLNNWTNRSNL